jgi:hypothetical protein
MEELMDDDTVELVAQEEEPIVHQLGKLLLGTLVGFAATQLAKIAYDAVLERYRESKSEEDDPEV